MSCSPPILNQLVFHYYSSALNLYSSLKRYKKIEILIVLCFYWFYIFAFFYIHVFGKEAGLLKNFCKAEFPKTFQGNENGLWVVHVFQLFCMIKSYIHSSSHQTSFKCEKMFFERFLQCLQISDLDTTYRLSKDCRGVRMQTEKIFFLKVCRPYFHRKTDFCSHPVPQNIQVYLGKIFQTKHFAKERSALLQLNFFRSENEFENNVEIIRDVIRAGKKTYSNFILALDFLHF